MEVVQHYNQERFKEFVSKIKKDIGEWYIVDVSLTGKTEDNCNYIAFKLREYFAGRDGIIFICSGNNILILVHMDKGISGESLSNGIHEKLPKHSCSAQASEVTSEGLVKIQLNLESLAQNDHVQSAVSALLAKRQKRQEHVVMIVDDDALIRAIVNKTFLNRSRVFEFKDTDKVLDAYLQQLPDIVFLDIHLPGGSGIELLKEILRFDETAYVIILSSDSLKNNILDTRNIGAKGFIGKPFTLDRLESCYRKCPTVERQSC